MQCPKCGAELANDAKFCTSCGAQLGQQAQPGYNNQTMYGQQAQPGYNNQTVYGQQAQPGYNQTVYGQQAQPGYNQTVYGQQAQPGYNQTVYGQQAQPGYNQTVYGQQTQYAQPQKKGGNAAKAVVIVLLVLLLAAILFLVVRVFMGESGNRKIRAQIKVAQEYMDNEEYEEAIEAWLEVLEADSVNETAVQGLTDSYIALANSYAEAGDYEKALEVLDDVDGRASKKDIKNAREELKEAQAQYLISQKGTWTERDLTFRDGDGDNAVVVVVPADNSMIVYSDGGRILNYLTYDYQDYGVLGTGRGLTLGMWMDDYKELYNVVEGYAVWELYSGEDNGVTSFREFTDQAPAALYDMGYNNVWLDIGFYKEGDEWKPLKGNQVQDVWFCDANLNDYDEVVVFAVNFDYQGRINGLSLDYFHYDQNWVEWQDWAE